MAKASNKYTHGHKVKFDHQVVTSVTLNKPEFSFTKRSLADQRTYLRGPNLFMGQCQSNSEVILAICR